MNLFDAHKIHPAVMELRRDMTWHDFQISPGASTEHDGADHRVAH
jgi:hypothetical protein